jgi:N-acetylglucosaminyldiphosphoundecaprenol N-acetyl-beta-D-mannosaminyltransferase
VSLAVGAFIGGKGRVERHPGPAVLRDLCEAGQDHGLRHYFYGGKEGVGERLSIQLREMFPDIRIAGYESPPFRELSEEEELETRLRIENSDTDILWVGLGAPKQDLWMQSHSKTIDVPLMLGVGAAFEFMSGDQKWAPEWIRAIGMEWLFRMITGGPRLIKRYLKYVPLCCYYLIKEN